MKNPRIRRNVDGNWYGYLGTKKVAWFVNTPEESQEDQAKRWLAEQRAECERTRRTDEWFRYRRRQMAKEEREALMERKEAEWQAWQAGREGEIVSVEDARAGEQVPLDEGWEEIRKHYLRRPME